MTNENIAPASNRLFGQHPLRSWRLWGLIILVIYTITGFFGIPYIVKSQLTAKVPELLGRQITVADVKLNPFTLSFTIQGLSLADKDNVELVGLDQFHIDFDSFSLFRWAWTFSEISFSNPRFNLRLDKTGAPSFADLTKGDDNTTTAEPESTTGEAAMPRVVIKRFLLSGGEFKFEDNSKATPFKQTITPLNLNLVDFSTLPEKDGPYGIYVEIPGGGKIRWQGEIAVNPLHSEGNLTLSELPLQTAWKYVQDNLRFSLDSGFLSGGLNYNFHMGSAGPEFSASQIQVGLNKIEIRDKMHKENDIELPSIALTGGRFDLTQQSVHLDEFAINGGKINTFMNTDGTLHLAQLFTPLESPAAATQPPATPAPDSDTANSAPWKFELNKASINNFDFLYVDRNTEPNAEIRVNNINFSLTDITNQAGDQFGLHTSMTLNHDGQITISGKVAAMEPMADLTLDIKTIPLPSFQAYLNQATNIGLASGNVSLQGNLRYLASEKEPDVTLAGSLNVADFAIANQLTTDKLSSWKALTFNGIDLKLMPNQLDIASITLDQLKGNIVIANDGQINVASLVKSDGTTTPPPPPAEETEKPSEPFPISVGLVQLKNNAVLFTDNTVSPRFTSHLSKLEGSIKGLSSENVAPANVDISGQVDDYAKLLVTGKINPLSDNLYTDIKMKFSDYDMISLTPYTGRYIGNAVDKGRMSFDLKYRVSDKDLKGENNLLLDQFTLGNKIESKDAVNLPVGLAVALLKDTKGRIDFDVPVHGNLDDPKFRLSGAIFTALSNVITNIATSPFKMLSSLAGGGEDMDRVLFLPGESALLAEHDKRLDTLGNALKQRPQLLLEVRGQYDTTRDKHVFQQRKLLAKLEAAKEAPAKDLPLETLDTEILEKHFVELAGAEEITKLQTQNSKAKEGAADNVPKEVDHSAYKTALLQALITKQEVKEADLRDLARSRADTVRNHLVNISGLNANRIFILEATDDKSETAEGVSTVFTLTAK